MRCPLCQHNGPMPVPVWGRSVQFADREFSYRRCGACRSLACDPMPDAATFEAMYGTSYAQAVTTDLDIADPRVDDWVVARLAAVPPGLFVDYGCGGGALLERVAASGRAVLGVELAEDVAAEVSARTGLPVVTPADLPTFEGKAAAVHFGDVLEHVPTPITEMARARRLLMPGGRLLAQGPLDGNQCVFQAVLRLNGLIRRGRPVTFPPYHLHWATAAGQRALFAAAGVGEVRWQVDEVSWPAPTRLHVADLRHPRSVGLFLLRRLSQAVSAIVPRSWGNRYVFEGMV